MKRLAGSARLPVRDLTTKDVMPRRHSTTLKGISRMYRNSLYRDVSYRRLIAALWIVTATGIPMGSLRAQEVDYRVEQPNQRLEMVVNTSRILSMDKEIPRVLVNNKEVLSVVPISPNEVQISAVKPGVTQVNLWDEDGGVRSVDVIVYPDGRRLEMVLRSEFPKAAIRVRPLENSVILTGYVDRPEVIEQIVTIAQDFYPKVINNIGVGGVQQVALHVKVMEVSRTKIRAWFRLGTLHRQRRGHLVGGRSDLSHRNGWREPCHHGFGNVGIWHC